MRGYFLRRDDLVDDGDDDARREGGREHMGILIRILES